MTQAESVTDILVVGAGLGGVAAALAAAEHGHSVVLTEPTRWIGGQSTSQAVPPDENPWIEEHPGCASYARYRSMVRDVYRNAYPITAEARAIEHLNPGLGLVSGICHEPRVSLAVLETMLLPWQSAGRVRLELGWTPRSVATTGDRIDAVTFSTGDGEEATVSARIVVDASETGELLALGDVEHVLGSESQAQTGELHALPDDPAPLDQQAITWCFAIDWSPTTDNIIERPATYDRWRALEPAFWPGPLLGWNDVHPETLESRYLPLYLPEDGWDLWHYRRIVAKEQFAPDVYD
ncbi:MAG TPA: FAD-dependent oxidoreductase, partial [Thermomicrobiales bacterium]|nr:FAD-dependent oxidoreductase [Thermomicrobiales bacterium]